MCHFSSYMSGTGSLKVGVSNLADAACPGWPHTANTPNTEVELTIRGKPMDNKP